MRTAVFSDIHSNYYAFRACYEDALRQGADGFIFLGDFVSDLSEPGKTMDLVYEIQGKYPTVCLRGNREGYMLDCRDGKVRFARGSKTGSLLYTYEHLRERDFDFFAGLPIYDRVELNGVPVEIAHAVKNDDRYYFEPGDGKLSQVFQQMQCGYLLTGHSHRQYVQRHNSKNVINPGSVGVPQGGSIWPKYALLDVENGELSCHLREVRYDMGAAIHAQFENGLVDKAKYWAISILYDIITGEEYTMGLLAEVSRAGDVRDETLWRTEAEKLGMKFTEKEILEFFKSM